VAPEAASIEPERHPARQRQLPDLERRPLRADPVEPGADLVGPGRPHDRVVERAPIALLHNPLAASDPNTHLGQPRPGCVLCVQLQ
jgi:hypothetical protein